MYPRKAGSAWEIYAPAKLNLYLEVLGRREDGFHELETLMAPIRLYDRLQWRPNPGNVPTEFSLCYDSTTKAAIQAAAPADGQNLVWQAVELLARTAGLAPTGQIILTKRIPVQAGLGGGSSDAAAALLLANAAWGLDYPRSRLSDLAAELGSDVPFFLAGSSAICGGRGELVQPLRQMPRLDVVVVAPPQGVSTGDAFRLLNAKPVVAAAVQDSHRHLIRLLSSLSRRGSSAAARWMVNGLQPAAAQLCPWIDRLGIAFASTSCQAHLLTGSGSAYFGVMRSARHARRAAALLSSTNLGTVFATATCR
jgi:4-diphosphocytidyl-2-C-methyl-D-erythritol kinase